jgi:parallel beta-helix repeat protein
MVEAAPAGSVLKVPPCIYRQTVSVDKSLTFVGEPGAEIRGSDVWSTGWTRDEGYWVHSDLPHFHPGGLCRKGTQRCRWPEQVFYDGKALLHVEENPTSGQFSVRNGILLIADDPSGHLVEVTTRTRWIDIRSNDVTIQGFTMRHCANAAQTGGVNSQGHSNISIVENSLSEAHGALVYIVDASNAQILRNDLARAGQLGVGLSGVSNSLVRGNRIHENNTDDFSGGWEAGGLKSATRSNTVTVEDNDVYLNRGPGIWFDGDCQDISIRKNRVHDNEFHGIQYEISYAAKLYENAVWNNGWGSHVWGWGAGILIQNSNKVEVYGNILAWNAHGISVIEQERPPDHFVTEVSVHDNTIVMEDAFEAWALAWLTDFKPSRIFDIESQNHAQSNRYGYSGNSEVNSHGRFAWGGRSYKNLADFASTPAGKDSAYLSRSEQDQALAAAGIPLSPGAKWGATSPPGLTGTLSPPRSN